MDDSKFENLLKGQNIRGSFDKQFEKPAWFDEKKFQEGKKFYRDHAAACGFSMLVSLVSGLSFKNLLDVLVYTEQSDTHAKAIARYYSTFLHVRSWFFTDIWDPKSEGHKSIKLVRQIHKSVALRMSKECPQPDQEWISQTDLAATLVGFAGSIVISPYGFGVEDSNALESYIYFWRVLGYLHGLEDEFNPFAGSIIGARRTVYEITEKVLIPSLENPDPNFIPMAGALFKKSEQLNAFILYAIDLMIEGNGLHGERMPQERLDKLRLQFPVSSRLQLYRQKLVWQRFYRYNAVRFMLNKFVDFGVLMTFIYKKISGFWSSVKRFCTARFTNNQPQKSQ